jgi:alpha-tubulin suppressor-like RCC1 family protein
MTTGREGDEFSPIMVSALQHEIIVGAACGDGLTMTITAEGNVYGWGTFKDKEAKAFFNPTAEEAKVFGVNKKQDTPLKISVVLFNFLETAILNDLMY